VRGSAEWLERWAFGRASLRLSEEEFWGLHPVQFGALRARWRKDREREQYTAAWTVAML